MQAEMEVTRQHIVQLCFRSTYGLFYQPVRRGRGGNIKFCKDSDAYQANSTFRKSVRSHIRMLEGLTTKSYGAREEIRGSGAAILEIFRDVGDIVSTHHHNVIPLRKLTCRPDD
jgi:hypothetical protein